MSDKRESMSPTHPPKPPIHQLDEPIMIIEVMVSTLNEDGTTNLAPMGPFVPDDWSQFELRPFEGSRTAINLRRNRQGIAHITDDVMLIAAGAIGQLAELPRLIPGRRVDAMAIADACRWFEFEVESITENQPRIAMSCRTVYEHRQRDFVGFNRAKHAVLEAAILATRLHFLPPEEIESQLQRFALIIDKTGGKREKEAFEMLRQHVGHFERHPSDTPAN